MRTEQEMVKLILQVAKEDERIRAVYMNGSRANVNAPTDIFQDYDVVFVVTDVNSFVMDQNWINRFGEFLMIQEPERNDKALGADVDLSQNYGYLMLLTDGNRIDLHLQTKEFMLSTYQEDSLTISLLDKDGCLPEIPPATDKDYWITQPSEAEYFSCCNDFWWCIQNVAKGLWREELPYAKQMYELVIRPRLNQVVSWWIGMNHDYEISPGKMGKYFELYLPNEYWKMYRSTYTDGDYENTWDGVFITCELFRVLAKEVANHEAFHYVEKDGQNMMKYLTRVRALPKDAKDIF
ncbi:aminoglycoside 6-adenylyltransferase [Ornithinibacillus sp. BX22]|uniref:Aminoglycoside 6-adenylyltransferase n=1 Tax=Ornithinibacillus hominis TaxID=2763055 RepID=A0A923L6L7_9BACI|nr:aminoglycoside 6-adenylyltransferase [Ornithinibacillus hominis]MBC5637382.1 aminoglycoside 6-adenylyltransferase [Ornithinibacillus hominis]